jgi:hypothetical protein
MVPEPGAPRWEAMSDEAQAHWRDIRATPCIYCGRPISEQFWMLTWPDGRRAHEACRDEAIEAERALANNPFEIDRAARAAKMTQEGFKLLPSWERLRLIRETQNVAPQAPRATDIQHGTKWSSRGCLQVLVRA